MGDALHKLQLALPGGIAAGLANYAPDPDLPGPLGYVPGATVVEGITGVLGQAWDAGRAVLNGATGLNLPPAPQFMHDWGQRAATTEQQMYEDLGGGPTVSYTDELIRTGAGVAGNLLVPGLGWLKALKYATAGGALGAGSQAAMDAVSPEQPTNLLPPGSFGPIDEMTQTTQVADKSGMTLPPGAFGPTDTPAVPSGGLLPPGAFGPTEQPTVAGQPSAPAFSEAGPAEMTWGQGLVGLLTLGVALGTGRAMYRHGAQVGEAERILRTADPTYLKEKNDYEAAVIARSGSDMSTVDAKEPPLPPTPKLHQMGVELQDKYLESGARLQDILMMTAPNPRVGQRLAHQVGRFFSEQQKEVVYRQFAETGHEPESGVTIPSPVRWVHDAERLREADFRVFNMGMAARNEKNIRDVQAAKRAARGEPPDPVADRYNFADQDRAWLDAQERAAMSNPVIADIINRADMMHKGVIDMRLHHGLITTEDANRMRAQHPNYLPEADVNGLYRNNFGSQFFPSRGGTPGQVGKVTTLWSQYLEKTLSDIEANTFYKNMTDHFLEYQRNVPNAVQYLTKVEKPTQSDLGRYITIRRSTGTEYYKSSNTALHKMLTGENVENAKRTFDTVGKMRQMLTSGTTGTASLLTGRFVPFRNQFFTAFQAPINATGGQYGGLVSKAVGARLKPLTVPFDIPLNLAGGILYWGIGAEKRVALGLSHMLRPENQNKVTQNIRAWMGDAWLENVSNKMLNHYMNSDFYQSRARGGLGGQSLQNRTRMPALHREKGFFALNDDTIIRSHMANLQPKILIGIGESSARPFLINLRRMITEEYAHANEGVHDFHYALNKNNSIYGGDPGLVARDVRRMVGDPSVGGSSPVAQGIREAVPYSNVIVQGNRAMGRAISAAPVETIAAMVTAYGTFIAAQMLTAFASQENLDHYTKETSAAERAKYMHIYNGHDGERSLLRLPWPGESGWLAPALNELVFEWLNMRATTHDEGIRNDVLGFLKNMLSHHIDRSTVTGTAHGLNDAFNFIDLPPPIKLAIAATGGSSRIDFAKAWMDYQTGNLGLGSFVSSPYAQSVMPNHSSDDAVAHGEDGKRWSEMASSIFGLAGGVVDLVFNVGRYHAQGASWMDSLGAAGQDWKQQAKDLNPMGNTLLWDNATLLSRVPPVVEVTRRRLHELEKTRGARTAERLEGTTGGRNPLEIPVYETDQGKVPDDPTMRAMYTSSAAYLQHLDRTTLPEINNLEKQLREVSAKMHDPTERRAWVNNQLRIIADKYRYVDQEMTRLNDDLSQIARARVDIGKGIDWQGDVSQFMK